MNQFLNHLKQSANESRTENGAFTYRSSLSECLNLFYTAGAMRQVSETEIKPYVSRAYSEDKDLTMKILFYARDVRGGLGERHFFRIAVSYLAVVYPDAVKRNLHNIPEYGRWDDLFVLLKIPTLQDDIIEMIRQQLAKDQRNMENGEPVSLLAKWLPSVNTSSENARELAKTICRRLKLDEKSYRKMLSALRNHIGIIENHLRKQDYTFSYANQPARAMFCYRKAFLRNDKERYLDYLQSVSKGEETLHTGTLYPYDLIRQILNQSEAPISNQEILSLDVTWNAMTKISNPQNAIAVIDGSGSMYCTNCNPRPCEVALSLGLYFAEHSKGAFANHFITFSETPQLVEIKGDTIVEKVRYAMSYNEVANTNIQAVFDLILRTAVLANLPQDELPEAIYIISDMQFDCCTSMDRKPVTNFEAARNKFEAYGYRLPNMIFWNVNSLKKVVPVTMHQSGAALVSGATPAIFDMVRSGQISPYYVMHDILDSERYSHITA